MRRRACAVAALVVLGSGCSPPTPDHEAWADLAQQSLEDVDSEVATTALVLRQQREGKATDEYAQTVVLGAEEAAGTAASGFDAQQPPPADDRLHQRVGTVLGDAADVIAEARSAVVREDAASYAGLLRDLATARRELASSMAEVHGP